MVSSETVMTLLIRVGGVNRAVQLELLIMEVDHLFVNRELSRSDRRDRLHSGLMDPIINSNITPIDPEFSEIVIG